MNAKEMTAYLSVMPKDVKERIQTAGRSAFAWAIKHGWVDVPRNNIIALFEASQAAALAACELQVIVETFPYGPHGKAKLSPQTMRGHGGTDGLR
jgi:hypothetical protein